MSKTQRTIAESDVDRVFDKACIKKLTKLSKLPDADIDRFGDSIRGDVRVYARDAREPTNNDLHHEIKRLHDACQKRDFKKAREAFERISSKARSELEERWERLYRGKEFPSPELFCSATKRDAVCSAIASICRIGGSYVKGKMRPSGKRSITWSWLYYAPEPRRHSPKRAAERKLVMHLALTWVDVTGKPAPKVVLRRKPGPFARLVQECLKRSGAAAADAINLINDYGRQRAKPRPPRTV